ncbi:conserved hypothetical protein [Hahella chejuensis KCTC 2396]|uniref:Uncharacterized protein n=1 Tax=Hahella chejuensis (strain KCTC 2396) TaxID=349521 RepID=Q2S8L2_HAHCH|nr:hypothetical protein [Hahella chejuensis]ABC33012.1 conserved hypothetical protein [Hahella chejuensis KCTC 2396]
MNISISKVRQAYERHQARQRCLELSQQLLELITHIQQHRGATLAILGGDDFFEIRLAAIKPYVLKDLQEVQRLRGELISDESWQSLCAEWFTVNYHWRQDSAFHNFELHTHLIQQLLKLYKDFLNGPLFEHLDISHQPVARLTLNELPELMETAAQIRGIGTHCLASGAKEKAFVDRLGFLSRYFTQSSHHISGQYDVDELLQAGQPWYKLGDIWLGIERRITQELTPGRTGEGLLADQFFSDSSQLVFQAKQYVKAGLKRLKSATDRELETWINSSSYHTGT